ncbi:MAG: response regulator [Leptospirales bacterium]
MAKKTIMTIDDSSSIRHAVRDILSEKGYNVVEARHGEAGLQYLTGKKVHLILLDLNMPTMDGYEFLKEFKENPKYKEYQTTPIVILTTETEKKSKETAKVLGAYGWISKPFMPETLVAIVNEHSRD